MDQNKINHYGDELYTALKTLTPVAPLTDRESDITIEDAYAIQQRMIQRQLDDGHTVVGKKIGVTSKVVMDMLKVNQPDFGQMLSNMVFNEGEPIVASSMIAPKAEAEVAFILKNDLMGPGVTAADVLRATDGMVLAKNGDIISTSTGAAVQGSPVNAIAWLANTLGRLGIGLKAGEIILSGSQSPLVPVVAGDSLTCNVGGLGGTSVRFI